MKRSISTLLATLVLSLAAPMISHADNTSMPAMPNMNGGTGPSPQRAAQMMQRMQEFRQKAQEKYKSADTDGNGSLSRAEAQQGMPQLAKNFDQIDTNKDGQLSPDEIKQYYQNKMSTMSTHMQQRKPAPQSSSN